MADFDMYGEREDQMWGWMWSIAKLGIIDRPKMQTFFEIGASGNPIQLDFPTPEKVNTLMYFIISL